MPLGTPASPGLRRSFSSPTGGGVSSLKSRLSLVQSAFSPGCGRSHGLPGVVRLKGRAWSSKRAGQSTVQLRIYL